MLRSSCGCSRFTPAAGFALLGMGPMHWYRLVVMVWCVVGGRWLLFVGDDGGCERASECWVEGYVCCVVLELSGWRDF